MPKAITLADAVRWLTLDEEIKYGDKDAVPCGDVTCASMHCYIARELHALYRFRSEAVPLMLKIRDEVEQAQAAYEARDPKALDASLDMICNHSEAIDRILARRYRDYLAVACDEASREGTGT